MKTKLHAQKVLVMQVGNSGQADGQAYGRSSVADAKIFDNSIVDEGGEDNWMLSLDIKLLRSELRRCLQERTSLTIPVAELRKSLDQSKQSLFVAIKEQKAAIDRMNGFSKVLDIVRERAVRLAPNCIYDRSVSAGRHSEKGCDHCDVVELGVGVGVLMAQLKGVTYDVLALTRAMRAALVLGAWREMCWR